VGDFHSFVVDQVDMIYMTHRADFPVKKKLWSEEVAGHSHNSNVHVIKG
jgi:hypothetical protein